MYLMQFYGTINNVVLWVVMVPHTCRWQCGTYTLSLRVWVRLACMLPCLAYPHLHLCPAAVQQPPCAPVDWQDRGMYRLSV